MVNLLNTFQLMVMVRCVTLLVLVCGSSDSKIIRQKKDLNSIVRLEEKNVVEFLNGCRCVLHFQCDKDGFIITNGKGLIDIRFGDTPRIVCAGGKYSGELVCCKHRTREENNLPSATSPTISTTSLTTFTTSPTSSSIRSPKSLPCGKPLSTVLTFNTRIFTDDLTPIAGEFPWLAAIYRKDRYTSQWKHHKAGSLIHPRVVLTACHVVGWAKPSDLKVIVNGKIELSQIGDDVEQERNVEKIIKHPHFSSGTLYNNIALLILEAPYNATDVISTGANTICLRPEIPYENKRCFVAGWGKTPEEDASMVLKKVELPTHPSEKCEQMLRTTRYGASYVFHKSFMCAGGEEGKDACYGDGGSPLVCASGIEDTMYQVGIVAYGVACGKKDVPGIYSNVNYFNNWIVKTMKDHDIYI